MLRAVSFVIPPQFDVAGYFSEGLASVKIGNKYGYIDKTGQVAIKPQFDEVEEFSEGLASVKIGDKYSYGYIDKSGQMVMNYGLKFQLRIFIY